MLGFLRSDRALKLEKGNKGVGKGCAICYDLRHWKNECPNEELVKGGGGKAGKGSGGLQGCEICGDMGHWKNECPQSPQNASVNLAGGGSGGSGSSSSSGGRQVVQATVVPPKVGSAGVTAAEVKALAARYLEQKNLLPVFSEVIQYF